MEEGVLTCKQVILHIQASQSDKPSERKQGLLLDGDAKSESGMSEFQTDRLQ